MGLGRPTWVLNWPWVAQGGTLNLQMGLEGAKIGPQESLDEALRARIRSCKAWIGHQSYQSRCSIKIASVLEKYSSILLSARENILCWSSTKYTLLPNECHFCQQYHYRIVSFPHGILFPEQLHIHSFWAAALKGLMTYAFSPGGFSLSPYFPLSPISPLLAQIPALKHKSQPWDSEIHTLRLKKASRLKFQPHGSNPSLDAQIPASRFKSWP